MIARIAVALLLLFMFSGGLWGYIKCRFGPMESIFWGAIAGAAVWLFWAALIVSVMFIVGVNLA
jgi:hypothetical protein